MRSLISLSGACKNEDLRNFQTPRCGKVQTRQSISGVSKQYCCGQPSEFVHGMYQNVVDVRLALATLSLAFAGHRLLHSSGGAATGVQSRGSPSPICF